LDAVYDLGGGILAGLYHSFPDELGTW
jgi:hypothetical protein